MSRINKKMVLGFVILELIIVLPLYFLYVRYLERYPSLGTPLPVGDLVVFDKGYPPQFGFINLEDSSVNYLSLPLKHFPSINYHIFSDLNGAVITGRIVRYNPEAGVPILITREGDINWCGDYSLAWGRGRVWFQDDERVILAASQLNENGNIRGNDQIVVFNMSTCQIETVIYESDYISVINHFQIDDFAINAEGWMAVVARDTLIISPEGEEINRIPGTVYCPGWSYDGQYFAYITLDGIYLADSEGKNAQLIATDIGANPCLSWHFTKNYLVYTTKGALNILDVEHESEFKMPLERGYYPVWRLSNWNMP